MRLEEASSNVSQTAPLTHIYETRQTTTFVDAMKYMAPEQAAGRVEKCRDIRGLGAIL